MESEKERRKQMSVIKFILKEMAGNQLMFQVLEMDERFRAKHGELNILFKASNGCEIKSSCQSDICNAIKCIIFLRGSNNNHDFDISICKCADAPETKKQILQTFAEWVESIQQVPNPPDPDTYEF